MPLFFESVLALLNGDPAFFVRAIFDNLLWFFLVILLYWFLEHHHSVFGMIWWMFGLLFFVDVLGVIGVQSFTFTFPFFALVLGLLIYDMVPEKWSLLTMFWVFGMLGAIFLI